MAMTAMRNSTKQFVVHFRQLRRNPRLDSSGLPRHDPRLRDVAQNLKRRIPVPD
jgi:hypothetical protein